MGEAPDLERRDGHRLTRKPDRPGRVRPRSTHRTDTAWTIAEYNGPVGERLWHAAVTANTPIPLIQTLPQHLDAPLPVSATEPHEPLRNARAVSVVPPSPDDLALPEPHHRFRAQPPVPPTIGGPCTEAKPSTRRHGSGHPPVRRGRPWRPLPTRRHCR
ncbi:DUF317 domain-containing protein [Streptomyces sp. NPDC002825]|uniref:DUF317 domain-containing protein n=1 Tax=Streptomyces sp. NPDC002825 TaxID=3154666 RepID=UPI00332FD81C